MVESIRYFVFVNDEPDKGWEDGDYSLQEFSSVEDKDAYLADLSLPYKVYSHKADWDSLDEKTAVRYIVDAFTSWPEKF